MVLAHMANDLDAASSSPLPPSISPHRTHVHEGPKYPSPPLTAVRISKTDVRTFRHPMAGGNEEVFFIASSSSSSEEEDDQQSPRMTYEPVLSSDVASAPQGMPLTSTSAYGEHQQRLYNSAATPATMEDVLFGLPPPKPRPEPPFEVHPAQCLRPASPTSNSKKVTDIKMENKPHEFLQGTGSAQRDASWAQSTLHREHIEAALHAGGSPWTMPEKRWMPPPRSLAELRAMTTSDVREKLEMFFSRKDADAKRFKSVEARLLLTPAAVQHSPGAKTSAAGAAAGVLPKEEQTPTLRATKGELLARDRCRRLVNVSNWDAAPGGYDRWDVLLPSVLLDDCNVSPTAAEAGKAAPALAAASEPQGSSSSEAALRARRSLRPHQIEGIRFLWSVLAEGPVGQVPAVGCILAHTMGLGKTAQVIVFLHLFMAAFPRPVERSEVSSSLPRQRAARVLIVTPKSTQSGWKREFRTWSLGFPGDCRLSPIFFGEGLSARQRIDIFHAWRRDGGVLVIGYEALVRLTRLLEDDNMLRSHSRTGNGDTGANKNTGRSDTAKSTATTSLLQRRDDEGALVFGGDADPFTELVVCDEAHRLKCVSLSIVVALRGLHPLRRLLLTGTPLQNHLQEYWAMLDFCAHKYFSRKRFREYFIQPIEASANTRASAKEVDLARKKTFTLINEVRHIVQRVDSTPLRVELPPLQEYIVVVPPSPLQREMYRRFIQIAQHGGSQTLQFLPAVSYSGKIAAHPQLLFQMRDRLREGNGTYATSPTQSAAARSRAASRYTQDHNSGDNLHQPQLRRQRQELSLTTDSTAAQDVGGDPDSTRADRKGKEAVVIDSDADSTSSSSGDGEAGDERVFARAAHQSFSSTFRSTSLTYEELCVPPSINYTPLLEDGVKLLVAMKLVAAAVDRDEKVLLFSLSTQLLTLTEHMIAKVNTEWRRPAAMSQQRQYPRLPRPIRYCRLDGSHSAAQRAAMLDDFDRPDGPDLFLLSMKAGGVGVTITAATRVILLDTSFNPADDQQAIGRAYRYGQTRPVYVYRLMCYPMLEYSIFVQKLAKEWLFKTVIEESSVKRDGLSGMHLRELFSLLTKASKLLDKPLSATRAQSMSTQEVLKQDPMLGVAQVDILYAQQYGVFLEHDLDDQYGEAEEAFYHDYCRSRLFDTADDEDAESRQATGLQQRQEQRIDEAAQLQVQSKSLTSMIDDIIQSRAGTDPNLARLLTVMGLHVDPITGRVQSRMNGASSKISSLGDDHRQHIPSPSLLRDNGERFAPSSVQLVGGPDVQPVREATSRNGNAYAADMAPRAATLLLDSDQDSVDNLEMKHATRDQLRRTVDPVTSNADSISRTFARQPYARYHPGCSPAHAVDVDDDGSQ